MTIYVQVISDIRPMILPMGKVSAFVTPLKSLGLCP